MEYALEQAKGVRQDRAQRVTNDQLLAMYIREHASCFIIGESFKPGKIIKYTTNDIKHKIKGRFDRDVMEFIVTKTDMNEFLIKNNRSIKEFVHELTQCGLIKGKNIQKTLTAGTHYPKTSKEYVLVFDTNHPLLNSQVEEDLT